MIQTRDTIKQWFETGDYPTQQQFYDFFESILFKGEVEMADIANLVATLQAKAEAAALAAFEQGQRIAFGAPGFYDIPGGYLLEKIIVLPGATASIAIGSTEGGDEIAPAMEISDAGEVYVLNLYAKMQRRIYFAGIPANSFIIFFKRLVKQ